MMNTARSPEFVPWANDCRPVILAETMRWRLVEYHGALYERGVNNSYIRYMAGWAIVDLGDGQTEYTHSWEDIQKDGRYPALQKAMEGQLRAAKEAVSEDAGEDDD